MAAFRMSSDNPSRPDKTLPQSPNDVPVADLSHLYNEPDPRPYYAALGALDYLTPRHIQRLARWCCQQRRSLVEDEEIWVIDMGCGYATNAAGLRHGIEPDELYARYRQPEILALATEDLHSTDRNFFSDPGTLHVAGIDVASQALTYGLEAGLLSAAFSDDLVENNPSEGLLDVINKTSLIMESGVPIFIVPYVLDTILSACTGTNRPWIVTAPPRYTDMAVYEGILNKHDYVLELAHPHSLPHRKFTSEGEKKSVIADQVALGLDNDLEETEGYIYVNLFLARPADEARLGALPGKIF